MNKFLGFYELKESGLPTILWKEYDETVHLDEAYLWTVRTAIYRGNDLNLPRAVGVTAKEAEEFARDTLKKIGENGMVIYYPYFVAEKSGTLHVFQDKVVIEAVKEDLWNLVTYSDREVSIIYEREQERYDGNRDFITEQEKTELLSYLKYIKKIFRQELLENQSVLLEWSYAYNCDIHKNRSGNRYLVFYEMRTV